MKAISQNKQASLELLEDEVFVKNAFIASEAGKAYENETATAFGEILRNGTSSDLPKANREKALMNIAGVLKNPDEISRLNVWGENPVQNTVRKETAEAMTNVLANNTDLFTQAVSRGTNSEVFDKSKASIVFRTIQEYPDLREKASQTVANEYVRLVNEAVANNDEQKAMRAAKLRDNFVGVENETRINDAKKIDENVSSLNKAIGITSEVTGFYGLKGKIGEKTADVVGKVFDKSSEIFIQGNQTDKAAETNKDAIERLHQYNTLYTVAAFENESFNKRENNQEAQQFLKDLKTINDNLPEGEKILNQDGRLINIEKANGKQRARLIDITNSDATGFETKSKEVEEATTRLSKRMSNMKNNYLRTIIMLQNE